MSSTCFWTDLVGTRQICPEAPPVPDPDPPAQFTFDNFVFGPVQNADSTAMVRSSNAAFDDWGVPAQAENITDAFDFNTTGMPGSGPGLMMFQGPSGFLFVEHNSSGYYFCRPVVIGFNGWEEMGVLGEPPSLPLGYSNNITYNGSGNTATTGLADNNPPFFQQPTPIAVDGNRWWIRWPSYTDDGGASWFDVPNFPANRAVVALAARTGIVAMVCRAVSATTNTLVWSTNGGGSWSTLTLAAGPVENLAIAMSPTQVYRASGTGNTNAQFSNTSALGTATNVGGTFPKRRAWWTGSAWLVERLGTPVQIQRYTDLSTAGTSVFSFPAGTQPCGAFLAMGGGRIVVPALLSNPANHVDFYVSTDDGLTFALAADMRLEIGEGSGTGYVHGFTIAYRPPA